MSIISFIIIPVLLIIIAVFSSFAFKYRNSLIIIVAIITIALSCFKGCDEIKKNTEADKRVVKDSLNIESLKKGQSKMIADRKVDSANNKSFLDDLKAKFNIIKDSATNQPIFIGQNISVTTQSNQKGDNYQNIGTNKGAIGRNAKVVNEEKIIHPDKKVINEIIDSANHNKDIDIWFKYETTQDVKNRLYCTELINKLHALGYKNIHPPGLNNTFIYGNTIKKVTITKSQEGLMLFVDMY